MVVAFIVCQSWPVVIFEDLGIGRVHDMAAIAGENTVIFELESRLREGRRKLIEEILKS